MPGGEQASFVDLESYRNAHYSYVRGAQLSSGFYCFLSHKSMKSLTVAGPCPAYNAASLIMPN